eukprot:SAG25_NODE_11017_length_316_cov_0.801843_2_plen_44_part_01
MIIWLLLKVWTILNVVYRLLVQNIASIHTHARGRAVCDTILPHF